MIVDAGFRELLVSIKSGIPVVSALRTVEQQITLAEEAERGLEAEETRRCVLAGGYDEASFDRMWAGSRRWRRTERARADRTYSSSGAGSLCVFAARSRSRRELMILIGQ